LGIPRWGECDYSVASSKELSKDKHTATIRASTAAGSRYDKVLTFRRVLPLIRKRIDADLRRRGVPRERVPPVVVRPSSVFLSDE